MKIKQQRDQWQVTSDRQRHLAFGAGSCHVSRVTCHGERGVALVITLILLSVALVMTLAFLAISGHEQGSVSTQTDTATTRLAADAGLSVAEAQIAANILCSTNPYSFGLVVSTNYDTDDSLVNLTNLLVSPRAPVWLTNFVQRTMENRFYLDLNRNGRDDPNGWIGSFDSNGNLLTNGFSLKIGDPEWIGILAHPDRPYAADNPFIARFAFIAMPAGNSLDVNAIHNQTLNVNLPLSLWDPLPDGFFRNQGVGSWEINLAAFLADLNNNQWGEIVGSGANPPANSQRWYQYNRANPIPFANSGVAFNDAFMLLTNRYAGNYHTQSPVGGNAPPGLFTTAAVFLPFQNNIDAYSDGPLQTTVAGINVGGQPVTLPWAGANNTNRYFAPGDLFNIGAAAGFARHLLNISTNSTYDRYTFYRLLSQLGTDSAPESGRMNLNYDNLDPYIYTTGGFTYTNPPSATNFMAWTPLTFFTNAADRLLRAYTAQWAAPDNNTGVGYRTGSGTTVVNSNFVGTFNVTAPFGVTGIPVWVSNRFVYTPAVQRLLQLAANTYDASANSYFPSVFRPVFAHDGLGNVFIAGYKQVSSAAGLNTVAGTGDPQLVMPVDAASLTNQSASLTPIKDVNNNLVNVYGVPWIIGAKKGFPNFNAFTLENVFKLTRKLQLTRPNTSVSYMTSPGSYTVSQQLTLNLANLLDVECWNSYRADYTNAQQIQVFATVTNTMVLTNDAGMNYVMGSYYANVITNSDWAGYGSQIIPQQNSFLYPLYSTNEPVLSDSIYTFNPVNPLIPPSPAYFVNNTLMPHWGLLMTNRVRVVMLEQDNLNVWHVIDYAQLAGPDSSRDLTADIHALYDTGINSEYDDQWDANRNAQGVPVGMANQIGVSGQLVSLRLSPYWANQDATWVTNQTAGFRAFLGFGPLPGMPPSVAQYIAIGQASTSMQAPYSPMAMVVYRTQWGANDPLVHYLASDLTDLNRTTAATAQITPLIIGQLSDRYMPWGGNPKFANTSDSSFNSVNRYNLALKDPLVSSSDAWNFPNNKFPAVGWLGRVHRGTPWQTVFLKSTNILAAANGLGTWVNLTGDANPYDAFNTVPAQDRMLFDLFTAALNDNATRGTLSVNVGADQYDSVANPAAGLAAWSALFSGVAVPTPGSTNSYTVINPAGPAGVNSALGSLVTNINYTRNNFRNSDGLTGAFEHKGDILSVPLLSDQSPFLNSAQTALNGDAMYEWLPQQVMSLLRVGTPRYVIYSYGQALKPAPAPNNGVFVGGSYLATNYQVVAETATRAVVRFDTARTNIVTGGTNAVIVSPPHAIIEQFNILPPD
jgi:hypothetical protein